MANNYVDIPGGDSSGGGGGGSSSVITPFSGVTIFDDFITGANSVNNGIGTMNMRAAGNAGGGVLDISLGTAPPAEAGRVGIVGLSTGITNNATGQGFLTADFGNVYCGNGMQTTFEFAVKTPTVLSTGASEYILEVGLGAYNPSLPSTNAAALIQYQRTVSTAWMGVTANNGSITNVPSTLTVVVNTWYNFRIIIRADGSGVDFYGCAAPGNNYTFMGSSITNLSDINFPVVPWVNITKTGSASATQHIAYLDWVSMTCILNTPR